MDAALPSGQIAQKALHGDTDALLASAAWTVRRAGLIWLGMHLSGERHDTFKKAWIGAAGVQALVFSVVALSGSPVLPSGEAALEADLPAIVVTYAARSAVIALSLYLAGYRERLWRNAFAGAAAIELSVLTWAAYKRSRPTLPDYIVG